MHGRRGHPEVTLHVSFCRRITVDFGVVVDEGCIRLLHTSIHIVCMYATYTMFAYNICTYTMYTLVHTNRQNNSKCCYSIRQKIMQHMHGNIPYTFDCWADPMFHLLLLPSTIVLQGIVVQCLVAEAAPSAPYSVRFRLRFWFWRSGSLSTVPFASSAQGPSVESRPPSASFAHVPNGGKILF